MTSILFPRQKIQAKKLGQLDEKKTGWKPLSVCAILLKTLFKVKKSFTERSGCSKNFSCSEKIIHRAILLTFAFRSKRIVPSERIVLPVKKTDTSLRVVNKQDKANNSPSYRCAAIKTKNQILMTFPALWHSILTTLAEIVTPVNVLSNKTRHSHVDVSACTYYDNI